MYFNCTWNAIPSVFRCSRRQRHAVFHICVSVYLSKQMAVSWKPVVWFSAQYSISNESNPHPSTLFPQDPFYYLLPIYACLQNGIFPQPFSTKILLSISHFLHAQFTPLDLITRLTFSEDFTLWCSSLCYFLNHLMSSLSGSHIFLSTMFSETFNLCFSLNVTVQLHTDAKQEVVMWKNHIFSLCISSNIS
jgi:hypothetical protein